MIIAYAPILVCLIGLLVYVLATNAKVVECGRAAFWCGLLVTLLVFSTHTVAIGR